MNRREMIVGTSGLFTIGLLFKQFSFYKKESSLQLFVERKEVLGGCMRGYLLTQLETESSPTVACYVLEKPPGNNAPYVSAIPQGTYPVTVRTDGTLGWRLELEDVLDRTNVQIHIGNYPRNTVGCLLPGKRAVANQCAVSDSATAMRELKTIFGIFGTSGRTQITIRDAI